MKFICYPKCTTCQRAKTWLEENKIEYDLRDIKENNPTFDEIKEWHKMSGLPLKRFFNTSGLLYKSLNLKEKLPIMTEEEQYELLATDGMLVKRPLVINEKIVLVGFKEKEWVDVLKNLFNGSPDFLCHSLISSRVGLFSFISRKSYSILFSSSQALAFWQVVHFG